MQTQLNFLDTKTDTDKPIPTHSAQFYVLFIWTIVLCLVFYAGYSNGKLKDNKELIKHDEELTNIVAEQIEYEKSIAKDCK